MEIRSIILTKDEKKILIANGKSIFNIMKDILKREGELYYEKEHFWIMGLDQKQYIQSLDLIILGSVHIDLVFPADVYSNIISKQAAYSIIIHSKREGDSLDPKGMDFDIADLLYQNAKIAKTILLEFIIMTQNEYFSFNESGVMREVAESIKYITTWELKKRFEHETAVKVEEALREGRSDGIDIGMEEGVKRGMEEGNRRLKSAVVDMAKKMKVENIDIRTIVKISGLSKEDIEKL